MKIHYAINITTATRVAYCKNAFKQITEKISLNKTLDESKVTCKKCLKHIKLMRTNI